MSTSRFNEDYTPTPTLSSKSEQLEMLEVKMEALYNSFVQLSDEVDYKLAVVVDTSALETSINDEIKNRDAADILLNDSLQSAQTNLTVVESAVTSLQTALYDMDNNLRYQIEDGKLYQEILDWQTVSETMYTKINTTTSLQNSLTTETTSRLLKDSDLQTQITEVSSNAIGSGNIVLVKSAAFLLSYCGGVNANNIVELPMDKVYIITNPITLSFGLHMSGNTTIRGMSVHATYIRFGDTVTPCISSNHGDVTIEDIRMEGGDILFQLQNINTYVPTTFVPIYGRNSQVIIKNSEFANFRDLGQIRGYIVEIRGSFFNGGGLDFATALPGSYPSSGIVVGTTYAFTPIAPAVGTGLTVKILTITPYLTWKIITSGQNYARNNYVEHKETGLVLVIVYTRSGRVGNFTEIGLQILSPRYISLSETRFVGFAGVQALSSTSLLTIDSSLDSNGNRIPIIGALINGNTFYPADTETSFSIGSGTVVTYSNVCNNIFLASENPPSTTKNVAYSPQGLFNAVSTKGWNFVNNTNVPNSKAFIGITIPTPPIAGNGTPGVINPVSLLTNSLTSVLGNLQRFSIGVEATIVTDGLGSLNSGYYLRHPTTLAVAYISRVEPETFPQVLWLTNIPVGFLEMNVQYAILKENLTPFSGTHYALLNIVPDGVYTKVLNLTFRYDGKDSSTFFTNTTISYVCSQLNQPVVFGLHVNGVSMISGVATTDSKSIVKTFTLSGLLNLDEGNQITFSYMNLAATTSTTTVSQIVFNVFSTS